MKADPFWTEIAARAATLDERLSGQYTPVPADSSTLRVQEDNLKKWCEFANNGDRELFLRRLARDGLTEQGVAPYLGDVRLREGELLPDWLPTAVWILDAMLAGVDQDTDSCPQDLTDKVPFADLLWPIVIEARRRIANWAPDILAPAAQADLEAALLRRLARFAEGALYESFSGYRQAVGISPDQAEGTGVYEAFKQALRSGPLRNLITARPVLIRILATVTDHWIIAAGEFLERLKADMPTLAEHFPELDGAGKVENIKAGISDPHNHGRTVFILRFETGAQIVYKPRPVEVEVAWKGLSDWFEQTGSDIHLCAAPTWARDGYGWMGFVASENDLSRDQAPIFYRSAGQLLALLYCLKGSDMHHENFLIANGRPVVIDLETLFQPEMRLFLGQESALHAKETAQHQLDGGVKAVGLLPKRVNMAGHWINDGGLTVAQRHMVTQPGLRHINQDNMILDKIEREELFSGIDLTIDGEPANIIEFVGDIVSGFEDATAFLCEHKSELIDQNGPLARFAGATIRHVFRPTSYYQQIESASYIPQNQQNGFVWSLNFERLCRRARWDLEIYPGWDLIGAERVALGRLDVPLFTGKTDQDGVWADGRFVTDQLTRPAVLPMIDARIDLLAENRVRERAIIVQSILSHQQAALPVRQMWRDDGQISGDVSDLARTKALEIAGILASKAIVIDGGVTWPGADISADGEGIEAKIMDEGLYGGTAGHALFLAGCYAIDPVAKWRDLAFAALAAPRLLALGSDKTPPQPVTQIGGYDGLAGLVYVLMRCADLLDAPELLEDAVVLSARLNDDVIASDKALDVISGSAGVILVLVALYEATGNAGVLERAVKCGRHLPDYPANWKAISERALAGMSHGAAGTVYALLRLYHVTGDQGFLELANKGLAYERGIFDAELQGWPDLRDEVKPFDPVQWCHGATGIGFARMATLHILDDRMIRSEIDTAITATLAVPDGGRDNLCCGHAGRFSMLAYASRKGLGPDNLEAVLFQRLGAWLRRLEDDGAGLVAHDRALQTGLMQGLPGIGQALLEIALPTRIHPVLTLE
ncbi:MULTISPECIES: type 2 lanthipeptide synthetase LanM [Thalassospira]|uniref:Lantibiotic biosynthesis protein dehydration domain-containing protein n=2 Tax=Thalassospira TaxID=168934 RepID=A0A367W354_9PROT|nr:MULTISPECIES: type 2 lanthipeptide synthetase LanM [Thalassospira]MDG4721318.1 type 2 lanthipeptide synthetase LanM [Thalassospira sp. FZY0004]RCK32944.1 hypothetical protein TH19_18790 [Thalassospira profundimaris]